MIVSPLEEPLLIDPFRQGADELRVLSGYCGAGMVDRHLTKADSIRDGRLKIDLVYGMAGSDGVPKEQHQQFQEQVLGDRAGRVKCHYVVSNPAVHAKIYVWLTEGVPKIAYAGSANYTISAFGANRVEVMVPCAPHEALSQFNLHRERSIECESPDVESSVVIFEGEPSEYEGLPSVSLPFLVDRTGDTPRISGINWGHRGVRERNEAYLRALVSRVPPGFFPPRGERFTIRMDDGFEFVGSRVQADGKAIHSPESNAIIGRYFRQRLGVEDGALVTKADFERYGRDDVTAYKIDDETYYMDFSV